MLHLEGFDEHYLIYEDTNKLKYNRVRSGEFTDEKDRNERESQNGSSSECVSTDNNRICNSSQKQTLLSPLNNVACVCGCVSLKEEVIKLQHELYTVRKLVSAKRDMEAMDWFSPNIFEEKSQLKIAENENHLLREEVTKLKADITDLKSRLESLEGGGFYRKKCENNGSIDPRNEAVVILGDSLVKQLNSQKCRLMIKDLPQVDEKSSMSSGSNKNQLEKLVIHVGSKGIQEFDSQLGGKLTSGEMRELSYPPIAEKIQNDITAQNRRKGLDEVSISSQTPARDNPARTCAFGLLDCMATACGLYHRH